jgi:hypothetical protein
MDTCPFDRLIALRKIERFCGNDAEVAVRKNRKGKLMT